MALRLLEIYLPPSQSLHVADLSSSILGQWQEELRANLIRTKLLVPADQVESILNGLQDRFTGLPGFAVVILPVEACLPRPPEPQEKPDETLSPPEDMTAGKGEIAPSANRLSIEELYQKLIEAGRLSWMYAIMTGLATVVAAVGLLGNNASVVIGSMVIAPILSPNMALALATTLADLQLARKALLAEAAGILIVLAISAPLGLMVSVDPNVPEVAARYHVGLLSVLLALAIGITGALSIVRGVAEALVGVTVAVALVPPLTTAGLLLGSGNWHRSIDALLLFGVNVVSINLAAVVTFVAHGIRPRHWWEAERGKKAMRVALCTWMLLLLLLVAMIQLHQYRQR